MAEKGADPEWSRMLVSAIRLEQPTRKDSEVQTDIANPRGSTIFIDPIPLKDGERLTEANTVNKVKNMEKRIKAIEKALSDEKISKDVIKAVDDKFEEKFAKVDSVFPQILSWNEILRNPLITPLPKLIMLVSDGVDESKINKWIFDSKVDSKWDHYLFLSTDFFHLLSKFRMHLATNPGSLPRENIFTAIVTMDNILKRLQIPEDWPYRERLGRYAKRFENFSTFNEFRRMCISLSWKKQDPVGLNLDQKVIKMFDRNTLDMKDSSINFRLPIGGKMNEMLEAAEPKHPLEEFNLASESEEVDTMEVEDDELETIENSDESSGDDEDEGESMDEGEDSSEDGESDDSVIEKPSSSKKSTPAKKLKNPKSKSSHSNYESLLKQYIAKK